MHYITRRLFMFMQMTSGFSLAIYVYNRRFDSDDDHLIVIPYLSNLL